MKKVFCRAPHNYDMDEESHKAGLLCDDPSLAQQQFREECDINTIVERFRITGEVPQLQELPNFSDFEGIFDFQSAMNTVRAAQETFMSLPAKLRSRFNNDPQRFLEFCSDEENREEARKLGLLKPLDPDNIAPAVQPTGATNGTQTAANPQTPPQAQPGVGGTSPAQGQNQGTQKP